MYLLANFTKIWYNKVVLSEARKMKEIKIKTEYITLGQLLKFARIITDGSEAKYFLSSNKVFVNGELENRRGRKIYPGMSIKIGNKKYLVSKDDN